MAAGSQEENGIWADLVNPATRINILTQIIELFSHKTKIDQCPRFSMNTIDIRIITSPIRFIRAVIIPAARDFGFW